MKKAKRSLSIDETYRVCFDHPLPGGGDDWKTDVEVEISVKTPRELLKNNQQAAQEVIEKMFPGCKITSMTYV